MTDNSKTIDVMKGDRFGIAGDTCLWQFRGGQARFIGLVNVSTWRACPTGAEWIDDNQARLILTGFRYTITEPKPEPAPLAWPTHCVRGVESGLIAYWGDLDACRREKCDGDQVHPMPRQPLSAEMRELLLALRSGEARRTGDAIDALLKGGVL